MSTITANPCNPAAVAIAAAATAARTAALEAIPGCTKQNPLLKINKSSKTPLTVQKCIESARHRFGIAYYNWLAWEHGIVTDGRFILQLAAKHRPTGPLPGYPADETLTPEQCERFASDKPRLQQTMLEDQRKAGYDREPLQLSEVEVYSCRESAQQRKRGSARVWESVEHQTHTRRLPDGRLLSEQFIQTIVKLCGVKLKDITWHRPANHGENINLEPVCAVANGWIVALVMTMNNG